MNGSLHGQAFAEYAGMHQAQILEKELQAIKQNYDAWISAVNPAIASFINSHLKYMQDDVARANFMAYLSTVTDINVLFEKVLLIVPPSYVPPSSTENNTELNEFNHNPIS